MSQRKAKRHGAARERRRISADDVVPYLEAKGWSPWVYADRRCYVRQQWNETDGWHWDDEVPSPREPGRRLMESVARIAAIEGRTPGEVLAEIAAMERRSGAYEAIKPAKRVVPPGRHARGKRRRR
jgi:hypothetical protein